MSRLLQQRYENQFRLMGQQAGYQQRSQNSAQRSASSQNMNSNLASNQNALHAAAASMYGSQQAAAASRYGSDQSRIASMFGSRQAADASRYGSDQSRIASMYEADQNLAGTRYVADMRFREAQANNANQLGVANIQAEAQRDVAGINAGANRYASDASLLGSMYGADRGLEAQLGVAGINADLGRYVADQNRRGSESVARTNADASRFGSMQAANASRYGADRQYGAAALAESGRNRRFDSRMALLNEYIPRAFGLVENAGPFDPSTPPAGQPPISGSPALTPQQIAAQRSNIFASNAQQAAGQQMAAANSAAGRGLGAQSPLIQALNASFSNQALARSGDQSLQWELGASQQNADHRLAASIAQEQQFAARRNEALTAQQNAMNYQTNLLQALAGMLGGV